LFGVLFGVAFLAVLNNGLILLNFNQFLSDVVIGVALVGAAAMDVLNQKLERVAAWEKEEEDEQEGEAERELLAENAALAAQGPRR
jgi:hypothetical protein